MNQESIRLTGALIDHDYFISAPIRVMVFSDRMEISNPGYLPHYLSVEQIRYSLPNRRNPLPASHALHLLSYRGLRSSISRALKAWLGIELADIALVINLRRSSTIGAV